MFSQQLYVIEYGLFIITFRIAMIIYDYFLLIYVKGNEVLTENLFPKFHNAYSFIKLKQANWQTCRHSDADTNTNSFYPASSF